MQSGNQGCVLEFANKVKQLETLNSKLTALHWIAVQIASEQDVVTMHNLIINGFSDITGKSMCAFYSVTPSGCFYEITTRNKNATEPFWLCSGVIAAINRALQERISVISLNQAHCNQCNENCFCLSLQICCLHDRTGKLTGLLVAYDYSESNISDDALKIIELYALQISLALENAMLNNRLMDLAITDGLTGLYNHRYMMEMLEREVKRSKDTPFCILLIDVDDFKHYNDNYGHPEGDLVLETLAGILISTVKDSGTVFRHGGEEFAIILPKSNIEQGYRIAENIRKNVAEHVFRKRSVTVSIGVAQYPQHGDHYTQLLDYADKGLYRAKAKGKNTIC